MDATRDDHERYRQSPTEFWKQEALNICWESPPKTILQSDPSDPKKSTWFPDGLLSPSYNLVTRHVLNGRGGMAAICWDSPVTSSKRTISYTELQKEMEAFSHVLTDLGVKTGDRVLIYSMVSGFLVLTSKGTILTVDFFFFFLKKLSADDSGGSDCDACLHEYWCGARCCLWRVCADGMCETRRQCRAGGCVDC
jgi:propionyl-CoA synthetase